jgi:hypothetical protein
MSYLLQEDGVSRIILEDGSGFLLLEDSTAIIPVVNPASFTANNGLNVFIGTVTATNSPTSFAIVSGNPSGFFSIDSSGNLSTTGIAAPNGVYSLGVTATNIAGTSPSVAIGVTLSALGFPLTLGLRLRLHS